MQNEQQQSQPSTLRTGPSGPVAALPCPKRCPGESAQAFRAFLHYCYLPKPRSLDRAFDDYRPKNATAGAVVRKRRAPGQWTRWATDYRWVQRAAEFDIEVENFKLAAENERASRLKEERAAFEVANQRRLQNRVAKMEAVLDKADNAPVTDVTQSKDETVNGRLTRSKTKVKGINFSGYAALVKQTNETARQAITGVRIDNKDENPVTLTAGLFWDSAPDGSAPAGD